MPWKSNSAGQEDRVRATKAAASKPARAWCIGALAILAASAPARGTTILFSSLAGANPSQGTTGISASFWAGMSFVTDASSYQLTTVTVNLAQGTGTTGSVTAFLFSNAGSVVPDTPLMTLGTLNDSALPDPAATGFGSFSFAGNAFPLAANTSYWIVLEGSSTGGATDALWENSFSGSGIHANSQSVASASPPPNWSSVFLFQAFSWQTVEVDAQSVGSTATPEPTTAWAGCALALVVVLAHVRRTNRC